ncbi:MAG: hypothetical protein ACM3XM_16400, partial [Mycobacterium leprae]
LSTESTNQSLGRLLLQWGVVVPLGLWVLRAHWSNAAGRVAVATTAGTVFTYMRVALGFQSFHAPYSPLSDGLLLGVTLIAAVLVDAWIRDWEEAQALVT